MSSFPDTACSNIGWRSSLRSSVLALLCGVACWFSLCPDVSAHDIPSDVKLLVFVKPRAQQLTLLVRVPMAALREIDVPLRPGGFIDLARAEPIRQLADQVRANHRRIRLDQPRNRF